MPSASSFSSWEWLSAWWRANGYGNRLMALAFFDVDHEILVGLAMTYVDTKCRLAGLQLKVVRLVGDGSGDSDNLDILVRAGYEGSVADSLVRFLATRPGSLDLCVLNTLPSSSPVGNLLPALLQKRGWSHIVAHSPCSTINLPASWEVYLKQLSSKERGKIRYYTKRLEKRYQVHLFKCEREADLAGCLESFFELHQKRWRIRGQAGSFSSPVRRQFYKEIAESFLKRRWLEFWFLELDGKRVAADFNFRYGQTVYALQSGFDPEYTEDSVGYVLKARMLENLVTAGLRRYDFLGGLSDYKMRWSAKQGAYCNMSFANPFSRGGLYLCFLRGASRSKEWMKGHLPVAVWNLLRGIRMTSLGHAVLGPELEAHLRTLNSASEHSSIASVT